MTLVHLMKTLPDERIHTAHCCHTAQAPAEKSPEQCMGVCVQNKNWKEILKCSSGMMQRETSAPQRSEPESRSWLFCSTSYRGLNSPASQINKFCYIKLGFVDGRLIFAVLPFWKATVMPVKMFLLHPGGRKAQRADCLREKLSHGETKSAWVVTGLGLRFWTFQHVTNHLWLDTSIAGAT